MVSPLPLLALDAAVIDTETTGLDPEKARILQIGVVYLEHGALLESPVFEQKLNPGVPIPPETTRVHGLDAASLHGKPEFRDVFAPFAAFLGGRILIGHNIGFDLAILARECQRAGLPSVTNRVLDTRLLGELCFPRLGGFTLDKLASHLGVTGENRHDALGDARLTARLFLALIPALRSHGIRSLDEAETACRRMTGVLDDYNRAGWVEPVRAPAPPADVLGRIDAFPFRHRAGEIASMPPVFCGPGATLGEVVRIMAEKGISSVFVSAAPEGLSAPIGIITERDVIRLVGSQGESVLHRPVGDLASRPLISVPADAFLYRAIGRMDRRHVRHLGVVDDSGAVIGALSARDLLRLRASDALALGDAIDSGTSTAELAKAWARMPAVARRLLDEQIAPSEIAAVISHEIGDLTRRASQEAQARMLADGLGPPPAAYAVLLLGSGGRGEALLIPDQDNAIVHASPPDVPDAQAWFLRLGHLMNDILDEIGIPLCKGNVMAGNPMWSGTLPDWRKRMALWTETINPDDLLAVDIFYDFRFVAGEAGLASELRDEALALAQQSLPMVKMLAQQLESWSPPIGFFGQITNVEGRVDLKKGALFPIVAAARCLALRHGIAERSTLGRLRALREAGAGVSEDLAMLEQAHGRICSLILSQQLTDIEHGKPPSSRVDLRTLGRRELAELKRVLSSLSPVGMMVRDSLFPN